MRGGVEGADREWGGAPLLPPHSHHTLKASPALNVFSPRFPIVRFIEACKAVSKLDFIEPPRTGSHP